MDPLKLTCSQQLILSTETIIWKSGLTYRDDYMEVRLNLFEHLIRFSLTFTFGFFQHFSWPSTAKGDGGTSNLVGKGCRLQLRWHSRVFDGLAKEFLFPWNEHSTTGRTPDHRDDDRSGSSGTHDQGSCRSVIWKVIWVFRFWFDVTFALLVFLSFVVIKFKTRKCKLISNVDNVIQLLLQYCEWMNYFSVLLVLVIM